MRLAIDVSALPKVSDQNSAGDALLQSLQDMVPALRDRAAEALLEIVTDVMKIKVGAYSGDKQQGLMSQHIRIARLAMDLDAIIRLWEGHTEEVWESVRSGNTPSRERRAEIRAITSHVAHSSFEIIDELARCVGSRSFYADSPIQRFHRDMSSLSTHALFEKDHLANLYGAVRLGVELPDNAMV